MAYTWYYSIPIYGILQARIPSLRDLSNPGIEPRSPTLKVDSLRAEPPGKQDWPWQSVFEGRLSIESNSGEISHHKQPDLECLPCHILPVRAFVCFFRAWYHYFWLWKLNLKTTRIVFKIPVALRSWPTEFLLVLIRTIALKLHYLPQQNSRIWWINVLHLAISCLTEIEDKTFCIIYNLSA